VFGTSGIRGIYGKDITEALALKVSAVFTEERLVVGRDIRESGPSLIRAVSEGALQCGADVIDCGIAPTPTLALATKKHGCRGIMVTASHNPPEYNGLKLVEGGKEISKAMEKEVVRKYGLPMPQKQEGGGVFSDGEIISDHKELVMGLVDREAISKKKPKIIVDCNGAASMITPFLLSDLGCRVISVNSSPHCFNRQSEPNEKNLSYLAGLIRGCGADFAIAHDGDGDRCMIIDEKGSMLPLDVQLAIMIGNEMRSGKKIISTVEASLAIREVVEENGGRIDITPVGSTYVGDLMEEKQADFGGEPCGEYIYRKGVLVPDAVLAAAKFAEIFCRNGKFSEIRKKYPQNFMFREKFPARDKLAAMEKIKGGIRIEGRIRSDDGIRVDEEDGWFLVRASGTEPIIRLTMEYKTKEKLEKRKKELTLLVAKAAG
jgi:phosphoglucosamine mutase